MSIEKLLIRLGKSFSIATGMLVLGLIPGIIGFQWVGDLSFIDSLINSLSLLGTIDMPHKLATYGGQFFSAIYGLFIETVFLLSMGILVAPLVHRGFHKLHLIEVA